MKLLKVAALYAAIGGFLAVLWHGVVSQWGGGGSNHNGGGNGSADSHVEHLSVRVPLTLRLLCKSDARSTNDYYPPRRLW